ncbi:hypothetical protein E2542_SST24655 [Spatholobus suberectus]|nr:hypothetical protein E2542_SST24655 [Spatholobus suberectus]
MCLCCWHTGVGNVSESNNSMRNFLPGLHRGEEVGKDFSLHFTVGCVMEKTVLLIILDCSIEW